MNRIKLSPLASTPVNLQTCDPATDQKLQDAFQQPASPLTAQQVSVFVPMHYEQNYSYPLVVWLHADGDDCDQLQRVMPDVSLRNYVGIAPQSQNGNRGKGFYWCQDSESVNQAHDAVMEAVDHALFRFNLNSERIFLGGYGAGGTMAFRVAFQRPELFAGVISLNGSLPEGGRPLARLSNCRDVPVFWAHCRQSADFDQDDLCSQLRLLHVAGFSVTVRQYPCGDRLLPRILGDTNRWIMESITTTV